MTARVPRATASFLSVEESIVALRAQLVRQAQRMMRNRADAEDIAQDAIVAALRNLDRYRGDAKLATWLYRIGVNAALMAIRSQHRAHARASRALTGLPAESNWLYGSTADTPTLRLEKANNERLLRRALRRLPPHYRNVITRCDLDEHPIPKVAAALGMSCAGVRTRRLRALSLLRDSLSHAG